MLHESAVPVILLKILRDLSPRLVHAGFSLAGGTSLALRFGHRMSVDLDFFTTEPSAAEALAAHLGQAAGRILDRSSGSLQLLVEGVKLDCLRHDYPVLAPPEKIDGIPLWSVEDVAAMKLNAITNPGAKKDFIDVATLLGRFSLREMLDLYSAKYAPANLFLVIRSLAWFDDAENDPDPVILSGTSWPETKARISRALSELD